MVINLKVRGFHVTLEQVKDHEQQILARLTEDFIRTMQPVTVNLDHSVSATALYTTNWERAA